MGEAQIDDPRQGRNRADQATIRDVFGAFRSHWKTLAAGAGLSVLIAGLGLCQPLVVQGIVETVSRGGDLGLAPLLLAALIVLAACVGVWQRYILSVAGERVVFSLRARLIAKLLRLPIAEHDKSRRADLTARVSSDVGVVRGVLSNGAIDLAGSLVTFIGALVAMFMIDWILLAAAVGIVAVSVLVAAVVSRPLMNYSSHVQDAIGRTTAGLDRALSALRTVRASNATSREIATITNDASAARDAGMRSGLVQAIVNSLSGLTTQIAFLVIIGVGGMRVAAGELQISGLVSFILYLFIFVMPLGQLFGTLAAITEARGAMTRISEVLNKPDEFERLTVIPSIRGERSSSDVAVEFDEVTFGYSDDSELGSVGLREVSFSVQSGSRTAIVGPSGAGKSTALALIERFYDPTGGCIRIGGTDIRSMSHDELRARIGYVEQDAPALAGTIRENLLLASPDADDEDCKRALQLVNLSHLNHGLDSEVGESGVLLSGGERQRLAIARTLLNAPEILLLDESTSSLDSRNEADLKAALDQIGIERTVVVVAHRLSTVVDSDEIIVMDEGRVIARGTHEELVRTSDLYRDLAARQLLA